MLVLIRGQFARLLSRCLCSFLVAATWGHFAFGQAPPSTIPGDLSAQYEVAFQEMLRQPANLDVLFKFAMLASQTGDLEGAISALERMLLIDPALPRVRLELGVLYYRLGSYAVARNYLELALKAPNLPPEVGSRAEKFLAEIGAKASPSHFSGEVFSGLRYQSNANLGPTSSSVRLFGQVANLTQASVGSPDWGVVVSGPLRHSYDLGQQNKSTVETQLTAYANRQFQVTAANVSLLDFTTGPRFQIFSETAQDITIKPIVALGYVWVNDAPYYGSYGSGVEASSLMLDRLRNTTTFIFRRHNNVDSWYLPANNLNRGTEYSATTGFQYQPSPALNLFGNASATRFEADVTPSQSYQLWGLGGGVNIFFPDPIFKSALPWAITLSYSYQWWTYDAPDPTIDPTAYRVQLDSIINLVLSVPFNERTTLTVTGGRFARSASLPNYAFDNNNFMIGIGLRF